MCPDNDITASLRYLIDLLSIRCKYSIYLLKVTELVSILSHFVVEILTFLSNHPISHDANSCTVIDGIHWFVSKTGSC